MAKEFPRSPNEEQEGDGLIGIEGDDDVIAPILGASESLFCNRPHPVDGRWRHEPHRTTRVGNIDPDVYEFLSQFTVEWWVEFETKVMYRAH
jgi:hypothetical protein